MNQEENTLAERRRTFAAMMAHSLERFLSEPEADRARRIQEVCRRCRFAHGRRDDRTVFRLYWCNWDTYHGGQIRPCAGRDCVKEGIFEPTSRTNRQGVAKYINEEWYRKKKGEAEGHEDD